jgi:phosphatidylserine/phosphatidylglycerophosphate/cardiolipin synthase-like enzyme/subtilisin family serine protease
MDPALGRLIEAGEPTDQVAVLVRLVVPRQDLPDWVHVVATFGDIATVRVARGTLEELRAHGGVRSVKAPRSFRADVEQLSESVLDASPTDLEAQREQRRPAGVTLTGRGVVIGVVDWGLDFTHPAFRNPDGSTRLLALWDQQPGADPAHPNRYGYGRIFTRSEIDDALGHDDPVSTLGYQPWLSDDGAGTHGTATTSIAAGSAWPGGVPGVAPEADIVFVHASTWGPAGPQGLGDSVALAEALDFIRDIAANKPCVTNLSLGGHGGPHDGSTLLEQAMDAFVLEQPGRMIAQSCGNYFTTETHSEGELLAGEQALLPLEVHDEVPESHEIDVWYSGADRMTIGVIGPGGDPRALTRPGEHRDLAVAGVKVGEIRHRVDDPNDGRNNAVIRLGPTAHPGTWQVVLQSADVVDGRFHAWIEREPVRPHEQTRFATDVAVATTTTGTICNGFRPLAVGAYDAGTPEQPPSPFSSSGPTVDGRHKPDLLAPGSGVLVARSRPADSRPGDEVPHSTVMSGTSMAAPHVTGAVACLLEQQQLPAAAIRLVILESCEPYRGDEPGRAGSGYLRLDSAAERLTQAAPMARVPTRSIPTHNHTRDQGIRARESFDGRQSDVGTGEAEAGAVDNLEETPPTSALPPAGVENLLAGLAVTAHDLVDTFVLDRNPATRDRLRDKVGLLYGPNDPLADGLRGGDLLVRGAIGEGLAMAALLVDGELLDKPEAEQRGWRLESRLPGRYARVTENGTHGRFAEDDWARRITDHCGYVLPSQALLRPMNVDRQPQRTGELVPEDSSGATVLQSPRFTGDEVLTAVAAGQVRLGAPGTPPYPAPVTSSGAAVQKVQQALIDLGYSLPTFGADGRYGAETGRAVSRYKSDRGITPTDPVVGPQTILRVDRDIVVHDEPGPAPPPPPPDPDSAIARWVTAMGPRMLAGNTVQPLIDGPETFTAMKLAIDTAVSSGHYIYLLGWWLDLDVPLDATAEPRYCLGPRTTTPEPSSLRSLLQRAASKGVQIRVMLWDQTGSSQNTAEVGFVNSLPTGAALLDNNQLNYMAGSQHQKILIVNGTEGLMAFCGGIDINPDRICPRTAPPASSTSGPPAGAGDPLHDVHCRIAGPAADDLLHVFVKRWYANPLHRSLDRAKGPLLGLCQPSSTPAGTAVVRVGETFNATVAMPGPSVTNCQVPPPEQPLRTFRDRDVQEIFLTAIENAHKFIYWEDQYLVNMCAAEALRRALPHVDLIILLIADSRISDLPQRWYRRKTFIEHIRSHPQGAKLHVFTLCNPAIGGIGPHTYVHAKTMMVDDELAIVGSANCNRRGWESDTEVAAAIAGGADSSSQPFAKRLRQRLWMEHLGVAAPAVDDALASAPLWWLPVPATSGAVTLPSGTVVSLPARRVSPYDVNGDTDGLVQPPWDVVDPPAPAPHAPCRRLIVPTAIPLVAQTQRLVSVPVSVG